MRFGAVTLFKMKKPTTQEITYQQNSTYQQAKQALDQAAEEMRQLVETRTSTSSDTYKSAKSRWKQRQTEERQALDKAFEWARQKREEQTILIQNTKKALYTAVGQFMQKQAEMNQGNPDFKAHAFIHPKLMWPVRQYSPNQEENPLADKYYEMLVVDGPDYEQYLDDCIKNENVLTTQISQRFQENPGFALNNKIDTVAILNSASAEPIRIIDEPNIWLNTIVVDYKNRADREWGREDGEKAEYPLIERFPTDIPSQLARKWTISKLWQQPNHVREISFKPASQTDSDANLTPEG
jgi:hypothetical protein